jgi:phosphoribosylformylglycinamidine synthase
VDYRIEVFWRGEMADGRVADLLDQLAHLDIIPPEPPTISNLYFLRGQLSPSDVERVARELLVDPVVEDYRWWSLADAPAPNATPVIEVGFRPGVTDPVARHLLNRVHTLGSGTVEAATTATRYTFSTALSDGDLHRIAREVVCNDVIQTYAAGYLQPTFAPTVGQRGEAETVPLRGLDDAALQRLSVERVLFLSLPEMRAIRDEFDRLGRDPTDVELETLAQTWSEHCQHKTFKADIGFMSSANGESGHVQRIHGLLRDTIRAATETLACPWVRSAFVDNAGVIDFDDEYEVSFKVETHNHPSALEPFGGANTGIGGVIRDVIGVSARPIACTDVLCFGRMDTPSQEVPAGTLHPRRIARGVVAGIEDYGNKMGLPTVSGAILYDPGYIANPLVFCGCVGLARKGLHPRDARPGDLCVALGGRTGRDGLHGATFSSAELTHVTGETVGSVVQIGDPITEKACLEAVMRARDEGLYTAITDCGAGGFSSAVGEMGSAIGVEVDLQDVPLKYPGLRAWEIWVSEAQERMVVAVPLDRLARLGDICAGLDVEWTVIGRFTGDGRLRVRHGECTVADLDMRFLHAGWPQRTLRAEWSPPLLEEPNIPPSDDLTPALLRLLAHPDVASKEAVIRRYDHEVRGATVVKPLVGLANDGPSDAAVLRPMETSGSRGLALGCGINPHYGQIDPYAMAWAAVDEALRNVIAVGADPERVALLDNFCWGNPALPDRLGGLVRAAQGCHDAALAYRAPFISGKDSLNNEYVDAHGQKRTIPPTLLISSLGIVPDVRRAVTMDLKVPGNLVYVVGLTRREMGGSLYHRMYGAPGNGAPQPVPDARTTFQALHSAIQNSLVRACHDLSEGGLAVAAAEMCIAGQVGLALDLAALPRAGDVEADAEALFSETGARFLVEVAQDDTAAFEQLMAGRPCARIGQVMGVPTLTVYGLQGAAVIECAVDALRHAWQTSGQPAASEPQAPGYRLPAIGHTTTRPRVLILHATGTNRDGDTARAVEMGGGEPCIHHVNELRVRPAILHEHQMLILPGGFSYGDALGAGRLWAADLRWLLQAELERFVESGKPVLGICNGFQALVKSGWLPWPSGDGSAGGEVEQLGATLTRNESNRFECRWVWLQPDPDSPCVFTRGLEARIYCPVAHGEGRFVTGAGGLERLRARRQVALTYVRPDGGPAGYPENPNGSLAGIAGVCNERGTVLGLMPHPENHIVPEQHPRWMREHGAMGLPLFEGGIRYAGQL